MFDNKGKLKNTITGAAIRTMKLDDGAGEIGNMRVQHTGIHEHCGPDWLVLMANGLHF